MTKNGKFQALAIRGKSNIVQDLEGPFVIFEVVIKNIIIFVGLYFQQWRRISCICL